MIVRAVLEDHRAEVDLTLMKKANPFMKDGDPPWLSTDLRILKADAANVEAAQVTLKGVRAEPRVPWSYPPESTPFTELLRRPA